MGNGRFHCFFFGPLDQNEVHTTRCFWRRSQEPARFKIGHAE
jgi:hypothetical protein